MIYLYFFINLLFAWITGKEAEKKGYSRIGFELFALCFGIIALIVVLIISPKESIYRQSNGLSNADELIKYKQLLDQGIISPQEYQRKRKELLK